MREKNTDIEKQEEASNFLKGKSFILLFIFSVIYNDMSQKKINILVAGATGYVGLDLIFLLSKHNKVNIAYLCAQKNLGKSINFFDQRIKKKLPKISNLNNVNWRKVDLVFLSLPNGEAQKLINKVYKFKNIKFIDLSADFRLSNSSSYKQWYLKKHKSKKLIKNSIYAITELVKDVIKKYRIIANPGCYPTSIQLPLIPLLKKNLINTKNIYIDAKSGYSGAGKNFKKKFTHKNLFNSTHAYGIYKHRHMSELDEQLFKVKNKKIKYIFNPHIIPTFRGILSSIYLDTKKGISIKKIINELRIFYKNNIFIKIHNLNKSIGTGNVLLTNNCEISVCKTRIPGKIVIFSAIDNLVKGASGQAIQNMNIMYGFKESTGLK